MQNVQEPFPFIVSLQGIYGVIEIFLRHFSSYFFFGSGPKQVILRHVLYVGRKLCSKSRSLSCPVIYSVM